MKEERQNTPMNAIQPPAHKRSVWIDSYQIPVYTDLKRADEILYATDTQILGKPKKNYFAMVDLGAPTEEVVSGELKKRSFNVLSGATENALTPWRRVLPESFRRGAEAAVINTARQAGAFSIKTGLALMNKMGEAAAAGTGGAYIPTEADRQRAQEEYQRSQKWADDFNNKVKAVVGLFTKRAGLEKTQKDGFLYDLGSGAGSVLTSIAALAITRNPAIMSAIFGAAEGQGTYEQAIEAGVEPVKAYKLGLSNAAWIAATEFVGDKLFLKLLNVNGVLDKFTSKALKSIKKKPLSVQGGTAAAIGAARGGMIEGVQEATQSIGSNVINDVGGVEDTSWREKAKQALYEGFIAFILGGVPGGAAAGGNFFVYRQNIAKNLMAAGVKEEEAHKVATELANTAISEDFTKEALGSVSGEINSPLTAEDRDAGTFKATLTQAQQRKVEHNAWDAREQLKKEAQEAGMSEEEAEQTAEIAHANQLAFYRLTGIAPEEMRYMKLNILGTNQNPTAAYVYNQAAAMYKSPHNDFAKFYEAAQQNKGGKQSYYTHTTQSGVKLQIPSDTVLHDKKHPEMTATQWKKGLADIDNIAAITITTPRFGPGVGVLAKVNGTSGIYGLEITVFPNGNIRLNTFFKSTNTGVDAWMKKENARTSAPLRRGQAPETGDVISGRSLIEKAAGTPAPHFIGVGQALQRKDVISGQPSTISIAEIVDKIKTGDTFYQSAAMYRSREKELDAFYDTALKSASDDRSYYSFQAGEEEIRLPSDIIKHTYNKHKNTVQDWENILSGLKDGIIGVGVSVKPRFDGVPVLLKIKAGNTFYGVSVEIQPGYTLLTTGFKGTEKGIDAWMKKEQGSQAQKPFIFNSLLPSSKNDGGELLGSPANISIADIVAKIKTGDTFNQAAAMYIDNWAKNEPLQRPSHKKPVLVGSGIDNSIAGLQEFVKSQEMFAPDAQTAQRFKAQVRKALSDQSVAAGTSFDMGNLPAIYVKLGLPYGSLKTNKTTLLKATGKAGRNLHKVPQEVLENLPALVADPKAVFKSSPNSTNPNGYVAVLDATNDEGKQIIAAISPNKKGAEGFSFIPSVYDKGNFENFVRRTAEEGGVLYIKEKDSDIWGPLQSRPLHNQSPINSIRTKEDFVNTLPDTNTLWQEGKNLFAPDETVARKFKADVKAVLSDKHTPNNTKVDMGVIPPLYEKLGLPKQELKTNKLALRKALGLLTQEELKADKNLHNHNVPQEVVENLPKLLADPVAVFRSNTKPGAYVAVLNEKAGKDQIVAILRPSPKENGFTFIPTVYEHGKFDKFVESTVRKNNVVYIDKNRMSLPEPLIQAGTIGKNILTNSIRTKEDFVNTLPDTNTLWQEGENLFAPSQTSLNTYKEDLKKAQAGTLKTGQLIRIGRIGLYERLGFAEKPFGLSVNVLKKITEGKHNVKIQDIENLPQLIADPVAVFKSRTDQNSLVAVVSAKDNSNRQVITILRDTQGKINVIPSMYGKDNFNSFVASNIKEGNLIYIDEEKALKTIRPQELQLLKEDSLKGSIYNIRRKEEFVKEKLLTYNKNYQAKQEYYQSRPAPRGSVTIDEEANRAIIKIFQKGDASTIVHELAHVQLAMLARARGVSADEEFAQLTADLDAWLGAPEENGRYSTPQQEKFAQGFEGYLAAGKAPNKQLESVFEKFAQWLAEIYQAAKEYLKITPEVKSIFDRLLAPQAQIQKSKIGSKLDAAKKLVEQMKRGQGMDFEGLSIQDIKELLKTLSVRKPAAPKQDLLKDLRKHGAEYANAGKIDKEAYKNAKIYDKKGGVDDRPDVWLQKHGYMEFEESTEETLAAAYDLIQRALEGEKVYRIEDQVVAQARAAFEENMATILQIFPDIKTAQETLKSIAQLEKMGYRAVEAKDLELLRRTLSNLETMAGQVEAENTKLSADAVEKKRLKFEQDALRIKKRVMAELDKRQLAHKEDMKKLLKHAKTPQEIHDVLTGILEQMEAAWAQTDEGKRDLRKLAVPDTNWDKVRVELLKRFNDIAAAAQEEVRQAQQTLFKLPLMGILSEEQAAAKEKAEKVLKESNLDGKYVMAMQAVLRGIPHITYADVAKYSAVLARSNKRYRLLTEKNINEFINHARKIQERNYKKYMRGKLSALFNRKAYEKLGSVRRAKYTPYMLKFLEDASKIWGGSQQEALQQYEAAVESIDPDNPPSVFQALINRVLWIKADPGGEVTMQDLHAFYEDALAAVRGDAAQKRLDGERRAVQEANIRLAACLSLKERKLPKGIVTYLLHGGVDLQTFIDIAFGQYETDMYESDPLPSRAEQSLAALKKIAAGSEEETVPGLRPDFVQYGGTPDVTFIWGDNNKGLQHIAQKHGADILPQVIDTVVAGRVERFTASKKTLVLQKGNIEAVLSLDEHGKQKTWLLTGWDATSPKGNKKRTDANGQVSTGSAATQTLPTFSRQDLGAVLNNSIAQKEPVNKGLKKHKINFREELAPETNQIKEAVFNAQINKDILRAVGTAYQLKTSQQILDKIAEMQKDTMQLTNYAYVKDQANGEVIATLFKNGKPVTYNAPRVQTINRLEALTFWIWNQNHNFVDTANGTEDFGLSGRLHYAYGQDQLKNLFDWLTPQDLQAAKNLQELVEKHYEQESQVHQRIYGFKLPKVEFYFPSVTERVTDSIDLKQEFVQNSKSPSFIKKRVQSQRVIQRIVNPIDLVLKHLRRAGEFIFEAENYAANKRIFKDRDVESAFLEKFGQQDGKKLYSKFMALLDQQAPQKAQVKDEFYSVMNKLFNGWVKAVMGLKPITGIKQFASSVSFAENMPWGLWAKWFAEALANPRKTADFMLKASPYIQARYEMGGMNEYTARAMASDEVAPIKSRWNTFTNFMLINTRLGDKASLIFGGYPYMKYLLEVEGLSQQEAARVFEKQATRTLQSSLRVHLSQGQANADSFGTRMFLVFKNQQLQYVRKVVDAYVQFKNGEISQSKFAKTAFIYLILNPMVYTALTQGWFAADDDDREEDLKNLLTSPVSQFFGAYPFGEGVAGFFVDNAASLVSEGKLTAPRQMGLPMFDDITRDVAKGVKTVNADEVDTMEFINVFLAVAKYTGLPTQSVMNMGGGLVDIVTGKPVRGSLRAVGYTQNRAGKITGDKE